MAKKTDKEENIAKALDRTLEDELRLYKQRDILMRKAFASDDPNDLIKAEQIAKFIEKRDEDQSKSIIVDPQALSTGLGYKEKQVSLSYQLLRNMSRTHIPKAIIGTRIEQVTEFCEPQPDKYSPGFVIRPKKRGHFAEDGDDKKLTKEQKKDINFLTDFIVNCGTTSNTWHGDDFDSFTRKVIPDSLALDQLCFEVIRDNRGRPIEHIAVDGATMRLAITQDQSRKHNLLGQANNSLIVSGDKISGYYPSCVQVHHQQVLSEFYPWEMAFGIRNPQTDIYAKGYGRGELEDLISTVTNLLNADAYNANYFKIGSNPKGILRVSGNINQSRIQELKNSWSAQMAGVNNAHKLLVVESEKMDFVNTQASNKDMEFNKYYEFLIKLTCAIYKIDPSEIAFPMQGSSDAAPMFEGNNEARLKYSRDKGLKPLLRFYQRKLNKMIIEPWNDYLSGDYELVFQGLEAGTAEQELEADIKKIASYMTPNEIRKSKGMKDIEGGDVILNPVFVQSQQMAKMGGEEANDFIDQSEESPEMDTGNPFEKSINKEFEELFKD